METVLKFVEMVREVILFHVMMVTHKMAMAAQVSARLRMAGVAVEEPSPVLIYANNRKRLELIQYL